MKCFHVVPDITTFTKQKPPFDDDQRWWWGVVGRGRNIKEKAMV